GRRRRPRARRPRPPSRGSATRPGWRPSPPSLALPRDPPAHDDRPVPRARHRPADEQEVLLRPDRNDLEVARRHAVGAVAASHPLALEDAPRVRPVADRSAVAEVLVGPVRAGEPGEEVALHHTRRPATLAHAGDVHALAWLEDVADLDLAPDRRRLVPGEGELAQDGERPGARLPELAGDRLRQPLRLGGPAPHLRRRVAFPGGSPH